MQQPYPYYQQQQAQQFGGPPGPPTGGGLRRRRGPAPSGYQNGAFNFGAFQDYSAPEEDFADEADFGAPPARTRVGLVLPPNHKLRARSYLSRRKARSRWETIEEMPDTRASKPMRLGRPSMPVAPPSLNGYAAMQRQPMPPMMPPMAPEEYGTLQGVPPMYPQPYEQSYYADHTQLDVGEEDEEDDDDDGDRILPKLNNQQRMKVGLALLMIPSLIVLMSSGKKFKSESNSNVDLSALKAGGFGGMGGMGGIPGMGGAGGLGHAGVGDHGYGHGAHSPNPSGMPGMDRYRPRAGRKSRSRHRRPPIPGLPPGLGLPEGEPYDDDPEADENEGDSGEDRDEDRRSSYPDHFPEGYEPPDWEGRDGFGEGAPIPDAPGNIGGGENNNNDAPPNDATAANAEGAKAEENATADEKSMELNLEPEKQRDAVDDYEEGIDDISAFDGFDPFRMEKMRHMQYGHDGHAMPRREKQEQAAGNPDPQLDVEAETLDPALLQGFTDPPTLSDLDAPLVQLKASGFKVVLNWSDDGPARGEPSTGVRPFSAARCSISRCVLTNDKSVLSHADAVVIAANEQKLPTVRLESQRWIFRQSSPNDAKVLSEAAQRTAFNWTWSHRRDSEIISSDGYYDFKSRADAGDEHNLLSSRMFQMWRNKRRMVMLWQDDDCEKPIAAVEALKTLVDVDVYGKCGVDLCPSAAVVKVDDEQARHDACFKIAAKNYLFVVPVEKDSCSSALTHKVVQALDTFIIPVLVRVSSKAVSGPPKSTINSNDYKSPKDLADFLNNIGTDFNKYKDYMNWKLKYDKSSQRKDLCKLCALLHQLQYHPAKAKYTNIRDWVNNDKCPSDV